MHELEELERSWRRYRRKKLIVWSLLSAVLLLLAVSIAFKAPLFTNPFVNYTQAWVADKETDAQLISAKSKVLPGSVETKMRSVSSGDNNLSGKIVRSGMTIEITEPGSSRHTPHKNRHMKIEMKDMHPKSLEGRGGEEP